MEYNMVAWFEIPVTDMDRAKKFYETVFNITIQVMDFKGILMGWFPFAEEKAGAAGTLIKQESYIPSEEGVLIYFGSNNVQNELDKIKAAGGKIYQEKTLISEEHGYMAAFIDTEGNRVALYSKQ
ncbi:VOC family protein [Patiriisocius hiemis]|uniref:VOC family protein n=1 Tax=Patiriisocius hiemis TaxID=3075604 RepID=A0ABU2YBW3_9FLAO|nr:VOC family protein [Constantimarinum sp. W242]MDT0554725.1 VOC family protein [Constantimarinum sp. W242]